MHVSRPVASLLVNHTAKLTLTILNNAVSGGVTGTANE